MRPSGPSHMETVVILAALTILCSTHLACQSDDPILPQGPLQLGVTGSASKEPTQSPTRIMASPEVQRLILEIAEEPRSRAYIESRIADEFFTIEDMVSVGLLREADDRYGIDFNLLLVQDQLDILDISEELGHDLAMSILEQRTEFDALATAHGHWSENNGYLFYIVIGCFALDWDGLAFTREMGYRAGAHRTIDGHSFTPWAKERGATISLEGLYWGSHNTTKGGLTFTTFGDHHATPRFGLPDLWWDSRTDFRRYSEYEQGQRSARRLASTYRKWLWNDRRGPWKDIGAVILALHMRDKTRDELAAETGLHANKLAAVLDFLEVAQYVAKLDDSFTNRVLVLTDDDKDMVGAMVSRTRDIMAEWHEANYDTVRERLSHLTPIGCGVPFEVVYTEVWHFVFAVANRTLAEEGFFANPYAEERQYKGFLPVVWTAGLNKTS